MVHPQPNNRILRGPPRCRKACGEVCRRGLEDMWQRRHGSKNVCGIPQSFAPFFSLASGRSRSLSLSPSFAFVVSFIIPLICCAPARDHHNRVCRFFRLFQPLASSCVFVYKLCVSFSAVECPIQVLLLLILSLSLPLFRFLSVLPFPLAQRFLRAALIFAARGHYQLIDYFDCYLIPPSVGIRGAYVQAESLARSLPSLLSFFRVCSAGSRFAKPCAIYPSISCKLEQWEPWRRRRWHIWSFVLPFHTSFRLL